MKLFNSLIILLFSLGLYSCSENHFMEQNTAIVLSPEQIQENRRFEALPNAENTIDFVVIYDKEWLKDPNALLALLQTYELSKKEVFDIDKTMAGVHLEPLQKVEDPITIGKEISLFSDKILLVEVNGITEKENSPINF